MNNINERYIEDDNGNTEEDREILDEIKKQHEEEQKNAEYNAIHEGEDDGSFDDHLDEIKRK